MGMTFPIDTKLARRAWLLGKLGLKGKAIAGKLGGGASTDDANLLAAVGHADARDAACWLTENEEKVLIALLTLERKRRRFGDLSSAKAWMLCGPTGLSRGQIRRATLRLAEPTSEDRRRWGLLCYSVNGHIWLNSAGIAIAQALTSKRTVEQ